MFTNSNGLAEGVGADRQPGPRSWLDSILDTVAAFVTELDLAHLAAAEYSELTTYLPPDAAANIVARLYRS